MTDQPHKADERARREPELQAPDRIGRSERLPYFPPHGWRVVEIRPHEEQNKVRVVLEEFKAEVEGDDRNK